MKKSTNRGAVAALVAASLLAPVAEASTIGSPGRQARRYAAKATPGRRGRPRKFDRPSRAVTLTLPTDVIARLTAVDGDLSRAVVRVAESLTPPGPQNGAALAPFDDRAVITVPRNLALRERTGVDLVPLADGRALISFDERLSVPQLELHLLDALNDDHLEPAEREIFEALARILREARRAPDVQLRQRQIIVLHRTARAQP